MKNEMTNQSSNFHIEKSISVGHIITTVVLLVSSLAYFNEQDKRITTNTQAIEFIKAQRVEDLRRIEKRLDMIDAKLDRLISDNNS